MPYESRWPLSPPHISLPCFIFGSPTARLPDDYKILVDCNRPDTHYLTLHSLREWSKRLAAGLLAAGLVQGDRVTLMSGNNFWTPVLVMGVLMAGGVYNSANPAGTPREIIYQLKDCEPKFVFVAENCLSCVQEAAASVGMGQDRIFLFEDSPDDVSSSTIHQKAQMDGTVRHWTSVVAGPQVGGKFSWEEFKDPEMAHRTAILIYSSGTTGLPKGVEVTHYNLVACSTQLKMMQMSDKSVTQRRSLCVLPMYHGLGLVYYVFVAAISGIQTYMMQRYNLQDMLSNIECFRVTELLLVPPILVAMAKHPAARNGQYDLSSIRKVIAGAAPLGMEVTQQFEELWSGRVRVRQAWGMSEVPCIGMCWNESDSTGPSSIAVGELVPGVSAKLVREDGLEETRPGHHGELWIRGPNIMKGYWKNPKATAETKTEDGWLKSGDIAHVDEDGKWYIVDRKKACPLKRTRHEPGKANTSQELIKVRGAQVAPAELEALLLEHPQVLDAAVIGIKTASDDENPRAYVVPQNPEKVTGDEIVQFVASRVAKIKHLTGGVTFISSIPKNPSGKILRRQLRERAAMEGAITRRSNGLPQPRL